MVKDVTPTPLNDEQQSLQALRQYGGYIISAMIVALAGYFGWTYYQNHGGRIDQAAATDFAKIQQDQTTLDTLMDAPATDKASQQKLTTAQASMMKDLDSFISQHGNSIYTWQALMLKAKQQMDANDSKSAVTTLQKATTLKIGDTGLEAIATLRYAQALLADNQADNAQKALQVTLPTAFDASKEEILGDIAMSKQDKKTAVNHYQKAWQIVETRNNANSIKQDRALLRLKLEELGVTVKQPTLNDGVISQPVAQAQSVDALPNAPTASATASIEQTASTPTTASSAQ